MTRIEISGIGFSGTTDPESGLVYRELRDWDGRPDARGGGDAIPGGQGVYARTAEYRESRAITVQAAIVTASTVEYFEVKRRVESMPMFGEMRVDQGDGYWVRQVEVESIDIPDAHTRTWTPFTIDLVAPDPARYRDSVMAGPVGPPSRAGGLVFPAAFPWDFGSEVRDVATVTNSGAVPVWPRVVLTGAATQVKVSAGPGLLMFGQFDGVLVFDARERRAFLDGVDVTRRMLRREWPQIPAGQSQDFYFEAVDPVGLLMTVEYRIGAW